MVCYNSCYHVVSKQKTLFCLAQDKVFLCYQQRYYDRLVSFMAQKLATLVCEICLARNYKVRLTTNRQQRLKLKKYCPTCHKSVCHQETR